MLCSISVLPLFAPFCPVVPRAGRRAGQAEQGSGTAPQTCPAPALAPQGQGWPQAPACESSGESDGTVGGVKVLINFINFFFFFSLRWEKPV